MSYSKSLMLYQDEPGFGLVLKLIFVAVPGLMLVGGAYAWSAGETEGALVLLAEAFIIGLIFWLVFPRKYQVYEDHLRIALGGPLAVKVRLDQIKTVEVTSRTVFSVNFVTRITKTFVIIVKKRGMAIAITPRDENQFAEQANRALSDWARTRGVAA